MIAFFSRDWRYSDRDSLISEFAKLYRISLLLILLLILLLVLVLTLLLLPHDDGRFAEMADSRNGSDRAPWAWQLKSLVLQLAR